MFRWSTLRTSLVGLRLRLPRIGLLVGRSAKRGPITRPGRPLQHIASIWTRATRASMRWISKLFGSTWRSRPTLSSGSRSALATMGGGVVCPLLCGFAGDDKRVGVATSRFALILDTAIARLGSSGMRSWLDAKKVAEVTTEAQLLSPHLKAVACMFLISHCTRRRCCHYSRMRVYPGAHRDS